MHSPPLRSVLWSELLDLLLPIRCLGCDRRDRDWFCPDCDSASRLAYPQTPRCQLCRRLVQATGLVCRWHRRQLHLHGLVSYGDFHAPPLRRAIHLGKYENVWAGLGPLARRAAEYLRPVLEACAWQAVVPIPLAPARYRERGYNQAKLIAAELGFHIGVPVNEHLVRQKDTVQQMTLGRRERQKNVAGAFAWQGQSLHGNVLLVDDVITTGATLAGAARILRKHGAQQVWGFSLAYETSR